MEIYAKLSYISIFTFFLIFKHDFISFKHSKWWRHKLGYT